MVRTKRREGAVPSANIQHDNQRTERRQKPSAWEMLDHLKAVVNASEDAVVSVTLGGIITVWNRYAETLFGYSAAEAIGRPISLLLPLDRSDEPDSLLTRIVSGERVNHFETVRVCKNGTHIDVSLTVVPIKNWSGVIVGA